MVITLIGYRGSGKTSVARPLAARLGWDWIDADVLLEERAGRTIKQIFSEDGEPEFRRREREILAELLSRDRIVIAAGGGAVLNADTRRDMLAAGPVVWLQAPVALLEARITEDHTTAERRPSLSGGGRDDIAKLLTAREPLYREVATCTVDTEGLAVEQVVERVAMAIQEKIRLESGSGQELA